MGYTTRKQQINNLPEYSQYVSLTQSSNQSERAREHTAVRVNISLLYQHPPRLCTIGDYHQIKNLHIYRVENIIQQLILTGIQYACELNIDC